MNRDEHGASTEAVSERRREHQAYKNAIWWRHEIARGRIKATPDLIWLLRDLETAGGLDPLTPEPKAKPTEKP